ncbi:MAG: hypothetical protein Q8Q92_04070 [bacterium]|nr:hypothetical protein [bacterium]
MNQDQILKSLVNDRQMRIRIVSESLFWFILTYLNHYLTYPTARFQKEMMSIAEDVKIKLAIVVAFRGSAKSTIYTLATILWAILGKHQKKFIVILSQTQNQARQHLLNIKRELESNDLLRSDLGPFKDESDYWGSLALYIPRYNARIIAASSEQSIRGLRHLKYRPDLIIADDVEDSMSVRSKESRDKAYDWFTGDIIPAGDVDTKIIVVGNLLHEDSLLMRLRRGIADNKLQGIFRAYPLLNEAGTILWPGKFPDKESVETAKMKIGNERIWLKEYLLRIVPDDDQIIRPEHISRYDILPDKKLRMMVISVDLAISESKTADKTAIIVARLYGYGDDAEIYIQPNPINEQLSFPKTVITLKDLYFSLRSGDHQTLMLIEDVAYQRSIIQELQRQGINVEGVKVGGHDKTARLHLASPFVLNKRVHFAMIGNEELIGQLVGFRVERFDDLADAFTQAILKLQEIISQPRADIQWL